MTLLLQAMVLESPEERNVSLSVWILNKWVCGRAGAVKSSHPPPSDSFHPDAF